MAHPTGTLGRANPALFDPAAELIGRQRGAENRLRNASVGDTNRFTLGDEIDDFGQALFELADTYIHVVTLSINVTT